jgi:hypothetical protein
VHFYSPDELQHVLGEGTGFNYVKVAEIGDALAVGAKS